MLGFGPHLVMDARGCASRRLDDISALYRLLDEVFPADDWRPLLLHP